MKPIILKTIYCKKNKRNKATRALGLVMLAVGINRIFSRDDLSELLVRFQIMFPDSNLPFYYFNTDCLFTYSIDDKTEYFYQNDLLDNLGLEISESVYSINREDFLNSAYTRRGDSVLSGILAFGCVLKPLPIKTLNSIQNSLMKQIAKLTGLEGNDGLTVICKHQEGDLIGEITESKVTNAEKLAEILINGIDQNEFGELEKRVSARKDEIKTELRNKPVVKYDAADIPIEVKQKIYKLVSDKLGMKDEVGNPDEQAIEEGDDLMYLIWLWSNGFVEEGYLSWVSEHFDFDYDKSIYHDPDGTGPQLNFVREYFEIDRFFPDFKIRKTESNSS